MPGSSPARRSPASPGERLLRSAHSVGLYTARRADAARSSRPCASCSVRRGGKVLVSATRRGLAPTSRAEVQVQAECAQVRIEWPLGLLALLLVPLAVARLPRDRAAARALRDPLHEHRGAGRGRPWPAAALALGPAAAARAARADVRARGARPARGARCRSRASRPRSRSRSTSRARCRPTTSSRRGSAPRRRRSAASSTGLPDKYRVGSRHVLVRAVRRGAADARPQARARGAAVRRHGFGQGTAIGDALARSVELLAAA